MPRLTVAPSDRRLLADGAFWPVTADPACSSSATRVERIARAVP